MRNISSKMADNQYATLHVTCDDCCKDFDINLERTSPNEISISNGIIANRDGTYLFKCPSCNDINPSFGTPCEVYSRVVGYLRPVSHWNQAKQEEFQMRKKYKMPSED